MSSFAPRAGVWIIDVDTTEPCIQCRQLATIMVAENEDAPIAGPWCSLR